MFYGTFASLSRFIQFFYYQVISSHMLLIFKNLSSPHFQYTPSNILNSMKSGRKSGREEEEGREGDKKKKRKKEGRKKKSSLLKVCVQYESVDSQWQKVGLQIININLHRLVMHRYFTFENPQILLWLSLCSRTKNSTFWFQTQLF